jgi:DNA-binding MarR family transcriptional regulator
MIKSAIKHGLEHRSAYRFALLSAQTTRSLAGLYRKHGLTVGGWRTLSVIGNYEPIHPSSIAERTSVDPDKVTRAVDRLVDKKLVVRNTDKVDRRRIVLRLTARGRRSYNEIEKVRRQVEVLFLSALSREELASFYAILEKLEAQARRIFTGKGAPSTSAAPAARGKARARK